MNKLEHNFQTGFHPSAALNSRSNLPQILSKSSFDQPVARSNSIGTMISSNLISHQHLAAIEKPPFHQSIRSSDDHVYDSVYLMKLLKDNSIDKDKMSRINEVLTMLTTHNNQYEKNFHKMLNMEKLKISSERQDDEDPTEAYRLSAISLQKPRMKLKDELAIDTFKEKFVSSKWIKKLKHESHKLIEDIKAPAVIKKETFLTNDQRFFQKVYGNMNLGALRAVDKAYEERSQNDDKEERKKRMGQMREFNKYWHQQVKFHKDDYLNQAKAAEISDRQKLVKLKRAQEIQVMQTRQNEQDARDRYNNLHVTRKRDINLASDLSKQHLSVSKALQSHEHLTNKLEGLKARHELVSKQRNDSEVQKRLVKRYIEQRNLLRVMQSSSERQIIEVKVRNDKLQNDDEARRRVENIKKRENESSNLKDMKSSKKLICTDEHKLNDALKSVLSN